MNEINVYWHHDQSVWFEILFKHIVLVQMECPDAVILLTTQLCCYGSTGGVISLHIFGALGYMCI